MKRKKLFALAVVAIFVFLISSFLSIFNEQTEIEDAIVNPDNGDVAFAYYEDGGLRICAYDHGGKQLWNNFLPSDGGTTVYLAYDSENLTAYVSRTNTLYTFNRNGTVIEETNNVPHNSEQISHIISGTWKEWERDAYVYEYYHESLDTKYVYYASSSLWEHKKYCLYIITSNGDEIVLYEGNHGDN